MQKLSIRFEYFYRAMIHYRRLQHLLSHKYCASFAVMVGAVAVPGAVMTIN